MFVYIHKSACGLLTNLLVGGRRHSHPQTTRSQRLHYLRRRVADQHDATLGWISYEEKRRLNFMLFFMDGCMYAYLFVCMIYACEYVNMYVFIFRYVWLYCVCICMYVCVYVCMYVCVYVCMYEHDGARYFSIVRRRAACACLDSRSTSVSNTMCIWLHTNIHSCKCIYRLEYLDCPWNTVPNILEYTDIWINKQYK